MEKYGIVQYGNGTLSPDLIRIYGGGDIQADIFSFGAKDVFYGTYFGEEHGKEIRRLIRGNGKARDPKEIEEFKEQLKFLEIKHKNLRDRERKEHAIPAYL